MVEEHRVIQKGIFLLYLTAVAFLCFGHFESIPQPPEFFLGIPADKIAHFLMFLPYSILLYASFRWNTRKWWHSALLAAGLLAAGCITAYMTEVVQGLTSYRSRDTYDFLADCMALAVSSIAAYVIDTTQTEKYEK